VTAGDGPGNWGEGRMAQQAPADIEHDYAGSIINHKHSMPDIIITVTIGCVIIHIIMHSLRQEASTKAKRPP
jgi:hypothetical protein